MILLRRVLPVAFVRRAQRDAQRVPAPERCNQNGRGFYSLEPAWFQSMMLTRLQRFFLGCNWPEFNRFRLGGYDEFRIRRAAHPVNCSRDASSHGVLVASGPLGDDGYRSVRTADDRSIGRIKRRGRTKVQDKAGVFG